MNYLLRIFITLGLLGFLSKIGAQDNNGNNFYFGTTYQYGFFWQHRPSLADIAGGNIHIIQLNIGQESYGKSFWDQLYRYPDSGWGYCFVYLGKGENLGRANALYHYLGIPVFRKNKFSLNYRIAGGLAYLEQENVAIGSHINLYFDASVDTRLKIGNKFELINAFGATHFSNGAIKMPNLGVNLFSYRIGLIYKFNEFPHEKITQNLPELEKKNQLTFAAGIGVKQKRPDGDTSFMVASFYMDYFKKLSLKHRIGAGIDVFYDKTLFELMNPDMSLVISNKDIVRYGLHLSFEAQIKRMVLAIAVGTYLHANYTDDGRIYQKVALHYLLTKDLFVNVSLKTSKGVADFVDWGLGYQFGFK